MRFERGRSSWWRKPRRVGSITLTWMPTNSPRPPNTWYPSSRYVVYPPPAGRTALDGFWKACAPADVTVDSETLVLITLPSQLMVGGSTSTWVDVRESISF